MIILGTPVPSMKLRRQSTRLKCWKIAMLTLWSLPLVYPVLLRLYSQVWPVQAITIVTHSLTYYNAAMIVVWYALLSQDSPWAWYWLLPYSIVIIFSLMVMLTQHDPIEGKNCDTPGLRLASTMQLILIVLGYLTGYTVSLW